MSANSTGSYFGRHWRGDLPLSQAYWVNTTGLNMVAGLLFLLLALLMKQLPLWAQPYFIVSFWSVSLVGLIWQSVGVFRSAIRYVDESDKILLPLLVLVGMGVIWVRTLVAGLQVGIPQLTEAGRIFRGDPQWPDATLTFLPSGHELEYSGMIKVGSAAQLEQKLIDHPEIVVLHLVTPGGRTKEAEAMGRIVRTHRLVTYVDQYCLSAGLMVFMGGKERVLRKGAKLGFHSATASGVPDSMVNDEQIAYFTAAGVTGSFIEKIINTPSDSIWYPTEAELQGQGIITRVSDGSGFGLGTVGLAKYTAQGIEAELDQFGRFRALKHKEPELHAAALAEAVKFLRHGSDMKSAMTQMNQLLRKETQQALPYASDAALDAFADYQLEILRRNGDKAPREALASFFGKSLENTPKGQPVGSLPDPPQEADDRLVAALIDSPRDQRIPVDEARVMPVIAAALKDASPKEVVLLRFGGIPETRLEQIAACEAWEKLLEALKKSPPEDRLNVQRFLLRSTFGLK